MQEYLLDLNATQAAIRAGYSAKTARQQGARLLAEAAIEAAIREAQAARSQRTGITADRVLAELELLAFSDVTHYQVDDQGRVTLTAGAPVGAQRAVAAVKHKIVERGVGGKREVTREVELKLWDKPGSLKLAGRHVGLRAFMDRLEVTGKDGDPLGCTLKLDTRDVDEKGGDG